MGKYEPLTRHLRSLDKDSWSANFAEIEAILNSPLPGSAYEHRPWWANQKKGNHSQAQAWREAGWETCDVDIHSRRVRFVRRHGRHGAQSLAGGTSNLSGPSSLNQLIERAEVLTGITNRDELLREAVTELLRREAGRRLIALGGTMPDAEAPPRRRFD